MYGAQTFLSSSCRHLQFENDVEMYGAQTYIDYFRSYNMFENDVEMYGAQTDPCSHLLDKRV